MVRDTIAKALLMPFSLLYGVGVSTRNLLYDTEVVRSTKFSIPVISVGNLSIGGAGKTPHIEYLIDLLNPYVNVATLSRGYGRTTKGFRWVVPQDQVQQVGDEPLMYARKHKGIAVAVSESRAYGIPQIVGRYPDTQVVLLDDAFQHRSVTPFINILLTQYERLYTKDFLMPSGRLREWRSAAERADIIIVTKCPDTITAADRQRIIQELDPLEGQHVFFSKYVYDNPYSFYFPNTRLQLHDKLDVTLISAIANTRYLLKYIKSKGVSYTSLEYEDHHNFDDRDMSYLKQVFTNRSATQKLVLTTEKDAMRLDRHRRQLYEWQIPVYVQALKAQFLDDDQEQFDQLIKSKLLEFMV